MLTSFIFVFKFQFTTSQGGRHDPKSFLFLLYNYFNSRPHKEVDYTPTLDYYHIFQFQFTTSQGGRLLLQFLFVEVIEFQFTTSQGGRHDYTQIPHIYLYISIHDLTRRSTGRIKSLCGWNGISIHDLTRRSTAREGGLAEHSLFQFTTSQGGRLHSYTSNHHILYISIHDLTRRSTPIK